MFNKQVRIFTSKESQNLILRSRQLRAECYRYLMKSEMGSQWLVGILCRPLDHSIIFGPVLSSVYDGIQAFHLVDYS